VVVAGGPHPRAISLVQHDPDAPQARLDVRGQLDVRLERGGGLDEWNLDRAGELTAGLLPGINAEIIRLQLALARGDLDAVAAGLTQLSPANPRDRLRHVLLAARLATAAGDGDERDRRLADAAELGIAGGFGRLFTDDAPELLADLDELGVRTLRPPPAENPQLSPRELTVLRYLSGDLTHVDVGNELEVSANTVKSHARAIYRKLGVSSRQEALQVARQLDIL